MRAPQGLASWRAFFMWICHLSFMKVEKVCHYLLWQNLKVAYPTSISLSSLEESPYVM